MRRLAILIAVALAGCGRAKPAEVPPLPPLAGMEAAVVEKLTTAHARVVAEPGSAGNWASYARALHAHGLAREAIAPYLAAAGLAEMPEKFRVTYLAGHCSVKPDPERAVVILTQAAALRDDYVPLWLRLGAAHESLAQWNEAGASYERAEALTARDKKPLSHGLAGLGRVRLAQGRLDDAVSTLERARARDPDNTEVHAALAAAYARVGRAGESARAAAAAGNLHDRHGFPDPITSEMRQEGVSYTALELLGSAALLAGAHDRALASYERALALRPGDPDAMLNKAQALCALGRFTDAEPIVDRALGLKADSPVALGLKGACALAREDHRGAVAYLARTLELDPRNPTNRWNYARALRANGNAAEAKKQFRTLLDNKPHRSDVRLDFARFLEQDGNVGEALAEVDLVLGGDPENRDAKTLRARLTR